MHHKYAFASTIMNSQASALIRKKCLLFKEDLLQAVNNI